MIKKDDFLIALDLDGTLIKDGYIYSEETFEFLRNLPANYKVLIATGRPYRSSKVYYDLLNLKTPIINYNGSYIHNPQDKNFPKLKLFIDKDKLYDFIIDLGDDYINAFCEIEDDIYLWKKSQEIKRYLSHENQNMSIGPFNQTLDDHPHGALIFSKKNSANKLHNLINSKYHPYFDIRIWENGEVVLSELYNKQVSKAYGLQKVSEYYLIPAENIIAIGDGHNDIEMIAYAHIGVAMANSHPELFPYADIITKSIDEDGVLYFLKKHIYNE